jgi:hypothetical protein
MGSCRIEGCVESKIMIVSDWYSLILDNITIVYIVVVRRHISLTGVYLYNVAPSP